MYSITAQFNGKRENGYSFSRQVPTFFLDESVQGIIDENHAWNIALDILDPIDSFRAAHPLNIIDVVVVKL